MGATGSEFVPDSEDDSGDDGLFPDDSEEVQFVPDSAIGAEDEFVPDSIGEVDVEEVVVAPAGSVVGAQLDENEAGDDDLLRAPDLGGQGEHNPPPSPEQQEEEEPATSATGPIPAVPLRTRPPSTTATSAPKGTKRAGSTAAWEAKAKKQRRQQPKKVPEQAGAPIKFAQGGGSRQAPRVVSPLPRQRREQTPQPSSRAPTPPPPAGTPPPAGAPSFAVPPASAPDRGTL
nr:predicted GPI-anchored protein 58 [Lolium perenne]